MILGKVKVKLYLTILYIFKTLEVKIETGHKSFKKETRVLSLATCPESSTQGSQGQRTIVRNISKEKLWANKNVFLGHCLGSIDIQK